jgi:hypothetical protein
MNILNKSGLFTNISASIVCYDALTLDDFSLKTDMGNVKKMTLEDMTKIIGVQEGSRFRINKRKQKDATKNIERIKEWAQMIVDTYK